MDMRIPAYLPLFVLAVSLAAPVDGQIAGERVYEPVGIWNPLIGDGHLPGPKIGAELANMRQQIDRARRGGIISRPEARRLRREVRQLGVLASRYARDGLSSSERTELGARSLHLRDAIDRHR